MTSRAQPVVWTACLSPRSAGNSPNVVKVIAIDGREGPSLGPPFSGSWSSGSPLGQGDEVTLPCGTRVVVTELIDSFAGGRWTQFATVVDNWMAPD